MTAAPAAPSWAYRPALDGLRCIAVYLVVGFHAGLVVLEGGFIGVDLFFVLSGFLVTSILLDEHGRRGRIDLWNFYARRVRRLLPAAILTILAVAIIALLVEVPLTRHGHQLDARYALLYVSNWHFVREATDYWAADVHSSPFLHFWSLSVEEQFYFAFPLVLIGLLSLGARLRPSTRILVAGVATLLAAGTASQLFWARRDPLRAYYGTDARVYQMLAGVMLAVVITTKPWNGLVERCARRTTSMLLAGGTVVATTALVVLATDVVTLSPSRRGIVAAGLAVATIALLELSRRGPLAAALSTRPILYLGKISYGTYLWHWPLIVFANQLLDVGPLTLAVGAAVGATAMASLSTHLVENPIRLSQALQRWPRQVVACGLALSVFAAFAAIPALLGSDRRPVVSSAARPGPPLSGSDVGGTGRMLPSDVLAATVPPELDLAAAAGFATGQFGCDGEAPEACVLVDGDGPHVFVLGDSNAAVLIPMMRELATDEGFKLSATTAAGCTWQRDLGWVVDDRTMLDHCIEVRDDVYDRVLPALRPDVVVAFHVSRDDPARPSPPFIPLDSTLGDGAAAIDAATVRSLDALTALGSAVVLIEPVPYTTFDALACLSAVDLVIECGFQASPDPSPMELSYRREATSRPAEVAALDIDAVVCPFLPSCLPLLDGEVVFRDSLHVYPPFLVDHRADVWSLIRATDLV